MNLNLGAHADVLQAQDETRITIDELIQEGQEYMLGGCSRAICIQVDPIEAVRT